MNVNNDLSSILKWMKEDKTFIILNGGTTSYKINPKTRTFHGSLNLHAQELKKAGVKFSIFEEPDLGDQLTAIVFLVDERVWDREKYPGRDLAPTPPMQDLGNGTFVWPAIHLEPESEEAYAERLGGAQNVWLREFLSQFRLA